MDNNEESWRRGGVNIATQKQRICEYIVYKGKPNESEAVKFLSDHGFTSRLTSTFIFVNHEVISVGQVITIGEDGNMRVYSNKDFYVKYDIN